jgi:hypothetical protein
MRDAIQAQLGEQGKDYYSGITYDTIPFLAHPRFLTSCKIYYFYDYYNYIFWLDFTSKTNIPNKNIFQIVEEILRSNKFSVTCKLDNNCMLKSKYYWNTYVFKEHLASFQQECFLILSKVDDKLRNGGK